MCRTESTLHIVGTDRSNNLMLKFYAELLYSLN